ncbi:MFS transporter [Crossiella sp. CA-258035]|uniref:MFS transporter n=1 Tax=Crossiella sp. CA-258035 TaxID=2981138 RepID=UPI0024BD1BA4|nr:MFS transporter [Crossiella sp. CA-258035]WHT19678.1 MFS transporter [Crossiella sp. CA-258035]
MTNVVALRRDPDFRRYLAARVISVAGSRVTLVAMPILVYQITGSAAWSAAMAAAETLPYLLFGLFAGVLADRLDRRWLMVAADLLNATLLVSIPVTWALGGLTVEHVVVAGFLSQTLFVVFDAANFGALPTLVGKDRTTSAYATVSGMTTVVEMVVPPLATLAVTLLSPAPMLTVDVLSYAVSALLLRAIVRPLSAPDRAGRPRSLADIRTDVRGGLAFLWRHPTVRTLTLVGATHSAAGGAWVAMLLPWADRSLGVPPSGDPRLAVLTSCWGVGALLAAKLVPVLSRRLGPARLALRALPASLLCGLLVVFSSHWLLGAVAAVAWGTAYTTVVINAITFRQQVTPDELQGRVNTTARMLSYGLGQPLGATLAGVVAVAASPSAGLAAAVGVLAVGVVLAWCSPLRAEARPEPAYSTVS